jgi:hypothetical protein
MPKRRATVYPVPGARSTARAVAYLVFEGDAEIDAWLKLRRLDIATHRSGKEERNKVGGRFRDWFIGGKRQEFHHGWPDDPDFSMGYVFRWDHQEQHRRLYGFLAQPRPGLEVCVLCCFRTKDKWRTEAAIKRIVRAMSQHPEVKEAIKEAFGRRRQE